MSLRHVGLRFIPSIFLLIIISSISYNVYAENTRFYDLEGFGHFLDGNPQSTTVTEDGAVALPPPTKELYSDVEAVYSAAAVFGDEIIVALADDAQVLAINKAGKSRKLFKATETMVSALLSTDEGLFVATGSPARIYKITKDGKSELYYKSDATYIWSLVKGPGGALYAATGEPGTVERIIKRNKGEVIFKPEQSHLRALAYDSRLGLFVGGGERGVVYRAEKGSDIFRALYDTGHPEVTSILIYDDYAFAAGVTGAQELADSHADLASGKNNKGKSANVRSQLVRIAMDGAVETLAGSSDEAIFALAINDKKQILVATGATGREEPRGRIYSVDHKKRVIAMLYQSPSRRITHLASTKSGAIAAIAAAGGRITELANGYAPKGEFYTLAFDAGVNSSFGIVQVFGEWPRGTKISIAARSGQTSETDNSWSDWSSEIAAPFNVVPTIPKGRFVQLRLTLNSTSKFTPTVHRVRLAYLRQNLAPFVREVIALDKGIAFYSLPQEAPKSKTVSLMDKHTNDKRDDPENSATPIRARQIEEPGIITIRWSAEDPNGDELRYTIQYRRDGYGIWRTLKKDLDVPFYSLHSSQLPDGHYQFRVEATDALSNPPGSERLDTRDSRDVLIDNTPPQVEPLIAQVKRRKVTIKGGFADTVSPIAAAVFSLDAKDSKPLQVDDGILDGLRESFTLSLGELPKGIHTLTVRVNDEAQNEGVAQTVFVVP
ncbi:MAG: fibronectin type III domain-containing protein [Deltaproteobacteria bacterium]|nr:fibronectin type III domain-containing protein [Deltaproteobacteria bacterium]